ncbi:cysteine hydrolase family protein [Chloroflexota bacterium]
MKDPTAPEVKPIEPEPIVLVANKTALLVLELTDLCADPEYLAAPIIPGVTKLLEKARAAGVLVLFTEPPIFQGKPYGNVYSGFKRRPSEEVFVERGFDKFYSGQIPDLLGRHNIDTLILTGCKANMAILYTGTTAAVYHKYNIVIPVDGIAATTDYEKEYTLYQFRRYPDVYTQQFRFTTLEMISFQ